MKNCYYPVEYWRPSFHSDALEDCKHGKNDIVERRNSKIWTLPFLKTNGYVCWAGVGTGWSLTRIVRVTRYIFTSFGNHFICRNTKLVKYSTYVMQIYYRTYLSYLWNNMFCAELLNKIPIQ